MLAPLSSSPSSPSFPVSFPLTLFISAFFLTWVPSVAQASLELSVHWPLPPMHWDYRCVAAHLAEIWILLQWGFFIAVCFIQTLSLVASVTTNSQTAIPQPF